METRGTEKGRRGRKRRCRRSRRTETAEKSGESPHITLWKSEREGRFQWSRNPGEFVDVMMIDAGDSSFY